MDSENNQEISSRTSVGSQVDYKLGNEEILKEIIEGAIEDQEQPPILPFEFVWSFGHNPLIPILNITTERGKNVILFASAHMVIVYDMESKLMKALVGHKNQIIQICADYRSRFILTCDEECVVNVWDRTTFSDSNIVPLHTINHPFKDAPRTPSDDKSDSASGIAAAAISHCAKYVVACSKDKGSIIKIWLWSNGREKSDDNIKLPAKCGFTLDVKFTTNLQDSGNFVITMTNGVVFGYWDKINKMMKVHFPERGYSRDFKLSIFVGNTAKAITATKTGSIAVWVNAPNDLSYQKEYLNILPLRLFPINALVSVDNVIAVGDDGGFVRFYDEDFKILYFFHNLNFTKVISLSFNGTPRKYKLTSRQVKKMAIGEAPPEIEYDELLYEEEVPKDVTLERKPFIVRDFMVGCSSGIEVVDFLEATSTPILHKIDDIILCFAVHPYKKIVCGSDNVGRLFYYHYIKKIMLASIILPEQKQMDPVTEIYYSVTPKVTGIKFSPCGNHLICAMENGALFFLDPVILTPLDPKPMTVTKYKITDMIFSDDSTFFAYTDVAFTIVLFYFDKEWKLIGKQRSHRDQICGFMFMNNGTLYPRLITISESRLFVEYDLRKSFDEQNLLVKKAEYISYMIKPRSAAEYTKDSNGNTLIIIGDDEMKFKIIDSNTLEIQNQFLGPQFDGPILKIMNMNERFLVLVTEKSICLYSLPINGNPYRYLGVFGNPHNLNMVEINKKNDKIFTLAYGEYSIIMWNIHTETVINQLELGGDNLLPYCCLIPGGKHGWFFKEVLDMFYFVQILASDEDGIKHVKETIPLQAIPDFMRSIGFFPSEDEIKLMLNPLKRKGETEISFDNLVILYINHKPVKDIKLSQIASMILRLCSSRDTYADETDYDKLPFTIRNFRIEKAEMMNILCEMGDKIDEHLAKLYLRGLYCDANKPCTDADIPNHFTVDEFVRKILGVGINHTVGNLQKRESYDSRISGPLSTASELTKHSSGNI